MVLAFILLAIVIVIVAPATLLAYITARKSWDWPSPTSRSNTFWNKAGKVVYWIIPCIFTVVTFEIFLGAVTTFAFRLVFGI